MEMPLRITPVNVIADLSSCEHLGMGLEDRERLAFEIHQAAIEAEKRSPDARQIIHVRQVQEGDNLGRIAEGLSRGAIQLQQSECRSQVNLKDRSWTSIALADALGWKKAKIYYAFLDAHPSMRLVAQGEENPQRVLFHASTIHPGQYVGITQANEVIVADDVNAVLTCLSRGRQEIDPDLRECEKRLQYVRHNLEKQQGVHSASMLTDAEVQTFYEQGFVLRTAAFNKQQLQEMAEGCERLFHKAQGVDLPEQEGDFTRYRDGSQFVLRKWKQDQVEHISCKRVVGILSAEPALVPYLRSKEVVHTFSHLLDTPHIEQLIAQLHMKRAGDQVAFVPHRDIWYRRHFDPLWKDVNGKGSYAVGIIAVDPMTTENGGLWVIPGTQVEEAVEGEVLPSVQELEKHPKAIPLSMNPGDILFMHPKLIHWSGPNTSSTQNRRTLLTAFCAYGANHKPYPGGDINAVIAVDDSKRGFSQFDSGMPRFV